MFSVRTCRGQTPGDYRVSERQFLGQHPECARYLHSRILALHNHRMRDTLGSRCECSVGSTPKMIGEGSVVYECDFDPPTFRKSLRRETLRIQGSWFRVVNSAEFASSSCCCPFSVSSSMVSIRLPRMQEHFIQFQVTADHLRSTESLDIF